MLVKKHSNRLYNKNSKRLCGQPMFTWNLKKMVDIFEETYVSSDDDGILNIAEKIGAKAVKRPAYLCGDTPNIPVYLHALQFMGDLDHIIAVQANSPTLEKHLIEEAKDLVEYGYQEIMTCHRDGSTYGSIWGLNVKRLKNYGSPYDHYPEILIIDPSIDVHNEKDFKKAEQWLSTHQLS